MGSAPAAAAAVGYNTETLGPSITVGGNWNNYDFFGTNPSDINVTQNADGSVTIDGGGNTYNGQLATATLGSNGQVVGEAFGGGLYAQATISVQGPTSGLWSPGQNQWPSFWSNTLAGYLGTGTDIEPDIMEMDAPSAGQYGTALHYWSSDPEQSADTGGPISTGADLSQSHTYGFLWVPATSTSQGYVKYYFDGQQVGNTISWSQNDGSLWGQMDGQQLLLILGAGPNAPMTVSNVQVWQASSADDIGVTSTTTSPPPPTPSPNNTVVMAGSTAAITDASGNEWAITTGGQVSVNGVADTTTARVIELAYENGLIWQENAADLWWSKTSASATWGPTAGTATSPVPSVQTPTPSPNNTVVMAGSTAAITDASGNEWAIATGGQVSVNGVADTTTARVIELAYENGLIWQENAADLWWSKTSASATWGPTAGTATSPVPSVQTPTPSPNNTVVMAGSTAAITDASGNEWTITAHGLVAVNGVADTSTNGATELAYVNGEVWQEAHSLWWGKTSPSASWGPTAGTSMSPLPASTTIGTGSDTLVLSISEDAYANGDGTSDANGDAAFTVSVDGKQLAGTFYATAAHSAGASQNFTLKGNWAPGAHTVAVAFLNDAYAGTPSTDRNLYVNDVTYDGTDTKQSAALMSTGSQTFSVTDSTAIPPVVTGGGSDSLVVKVSEDYYLANAQFTVSIDGKQLGGTFTATALHSSGNSQTFAFAGDVGSGQHTVSVNFLNDAWAGTPATDRNLYVNDIVYNGTDTKQSAALMTTGAKTFSVSGGTTPSINETGDHGSLQKNLSQTGSYTVGGDTFVLGSGNTDTVTLGSGTSQIEFVGPSSVTLTGGAGQAIVAADAGNNKFVAGAGSLDVTGGAGKDVYVFHTSSGLLTLEDFSLAKGDTLTIDKTLQGSLDQASDGRGGTLLTFGANTSHGVDIDGLATLPSGNILWA